MSSFAAKGLQMKKGSSAFVNTKSLCLSVSFLVVAFFWCAKTAANAQSQLQTSNKRLVTVQDAIQVTSFVVFDSGYDYEQEAPPPIALFSPNGKQFVMMLKKGNLEQNTNEFSVLLYQTAEAIHSPRPDVLLKMSSSSNRDAISNLRWLADSETLVFLGENPGGSAQLYSLNIESRRLKKMTNHSTAITKYDITADGQDVLFLADPAEKGVEDKERDRRDGIVVVEQPLIYLVAGNCGTALHCVMGEQQVFLQKGEQAPFELPVTDYASSGSPLSFSPDGAYAVITVAIMNKDLPQAWDDYELAENKFADGFFKNVKTGFSPFSRFLLLDTKRKSLMPLLDTPTTDFLAPKWAADGESLFFHSYLPLEGTDSVEREAREKNQYAVEMKLPSREFQKVKDDEFPKGSSKREPVEVTLEEDINTPPKIYVSDPKTRQRTMLLDPNPQLRELNLGKVETVEWKAAAGIQVKGGLYLPPNYAPGKKYPLVIQTHGFDPPMFSMDGLNYGSSGYAARSLAAKGIVILQAANFEKDSDRILNDRTLGATPLQALKMFQVSTYEGAIDELDKRGLIDRDRVGILGFSRSVCEVGYALTHSKYHFAAAILVDGVDCGYFQYMVFGGYPEEDAQNGGHPPFGKNLESWLKESPGFNLDKVRTPVRLEAHGASAGVLELWEWFAGLSRLGKPVDYFYLPDADHLPARPWERRASQQGAVDWFRFWLLDEEDIEPSKRDQYARWRQLRGQSRATNGK